MAAPNPNDVESIAILSKRKVRIKKNPSLVSETFNFKKLSVQLFLQQNNQIVWLRIGRSRIGCDDTRCCIMQFDLLMMSTTVLETCRGIQ